MKRIDLINNCISMVRDINPTEIFSHESDGSLEAWCGRWQSEMLYRFIILLADFAESDKGDKE